MRSIKGWWLPIPARDDRASCKVRRELNLWVTLINLLNHYLWRVFVVLPVPVFLMGWVSVRNSTTQKEGGGRTIIVAHRESSSPKKR